MKNILLSTCLMFALLLTACGNKKDTTAQMETSAYQETSVSSALETESSGEIRDTREAENAAEETESLLTVNLSIDDSVFPAKLYDNAAARELIGRMPMELDMSELHGNEKYYYLPEALPTDSENIGMIHTGDLMLYGSDCLVLFYEDFQTSYSYTRLGYLENPAGLSEALGTGSVTITFEKGN